jgi:hypothetical protein
MANIFPKWTNGIPLKVMICLGVMVVFVVGGITYYFTPEYTRVGYMPTQPVPFSHALHAGQLGMDCRYCHSFVEVSPHSNLPTTQTCMACHTQIRPTSPKLEAVRESWATGQPVNWVRVHQVPDFAYFNHAVHVNRGVGCASCHGAVNEMNVVFQDKSQSMAWCLKCHREPENFLRPAGEVYNMKWKPADAMDQQKLGGELRAAWEVNPPVTCGGCHR